jgi:SAM-dependent methyltransferase
VTELRESFESAADGYDAARPAYPEALFDDLVDLARLEPRARLLEIGCGTGNATRPLAERGFEILCVELGQRLAVHARANLEGFPVAIEVSPFENWNGGAGFDLVYSANAWHWLDPELRFRKAHALLRPNGRLAIWGANHAFPQGFDPFFTEIQEVYDEIGECDDGAWPPPPPDEAPDERAAIQASGLFGEVEVRRYLWELRYTADEYIALLDTFSGHLVMKPEARAHLYAEIRRRLGSREDPSVHRHWSSILHVARALPSVANHTCVASNERRTGL